MHASDLALWRYSVIAPLLHLSPDTSLASLARTLALEPKLGPDGHPISLSAETILRWFRSYRVSGLPGLEKSPRKDRGQSRALSAADLKEILAIADERGDLTVRLIHEEAERRLSRPLPRKALYRVLKGHRRHARAENGEPETKSSTPPPRRRDVGVPQTLWLADTMHGPRVAGARRTTKKSYLIAFMDDASRAVMAARFTTADDIAGLIPIFREAILARGCPSRLLCDNGPSYRSRVLRTACASLGIHLVHAAPYRPTSKARLERFFLTVRLGFEPTLPKSPLPLADLNEAWAKFLFAYHARPHSSLSEIASRPTTPLSYYLAHLPDGIRYVSEISLDELLVVEETRRVASDSTIRVAGNVFEVDPALSGERVVARFNPAAPAIVTYRPLSKPGAPFTRAFPVQ